MTPFKKFCVLVWGPEFSAAQVGNDLSVSRDTIRQWLKRETMPASVNLELAARRMRMAVELCEGICERLDAEDQRTVDEEFIGYLFQTGIEDATDRPPFENI